MEQHSELDPRSVRPAFGQFELSEHAVQLVFDSVARSAQGARDLAIGVPGEQLLSDSALGGSELRGVRRQKSRAAITWRPCSSKFSAILLSHFEMTRLKRRGTPELLNFAAHFVQRGFDFPDGAQPPTKAIRAAHVLVSDDFGN
jgi:hypothetical protein